LRIGTDLLNHFGICHIDGRASLYHWVYIPSDIEQL
jgi:hypothetical protein